MKNILGFRALIVLLVFLTLLSASCAQENASSDDKVITKSNVKDIINGELNYVFLTTEWCSASKYILKETYTKLCDSLNEDINLVLICATEENNQFKNYLDELGIECEYYLLPNKSSHEKILEHGDRKRIRHFIKNNLVGYKELGLKWQFGVPVILYVDKDLKIISEAPRKFEKVKADIMKHK